MTATLVKRCAECGSEFQPWVERCIDCGGPLEMSEGTTGPLGSGRASAARDAADDDEDDDALAEDDDELAEDYLPPEDDDVCLRVVPLDWARGLSAALADEGIPHRIDKAPAVPGAPRGAGSVGVWVRPEDRTAAAAVDAAYERHEIPDLPEERASEEHCPACGEPCDPEAGECASCGLEFPSAE